MAKTPVTTQDNPSSRRVEAYVGDGELAGYAQYRISEDGSYDFFHTEVDDKFEGQGIGGQLASGVLDFVRDSGAKIRPTCTFIRGYLRKHKKSHDLVAAGASLEPDPE